MEWGDVLTIVLVLAGVWYIIVPRAVREGLSPAVHALAEAMRAALRSCAPFVHWLAYEVIIGRKPVKDYADTSAALMSRSADDEGGSRSSDHRQTELRPDEPPARPKPTEAELLTLFTAFKEAGYDRDEARAILRPFGVPVDNNLFSRAPKPNINPPGDPSIQVPAYETPPR